ncbi:MAG: LysR family transcriptional regulator [Thermovirgaceae bacterium]|nr:LysR family transcriptional regulator [Thermovirgaceae bacterium]
MITLFQLHSFCCVVEEGSFRSAAERLFVSQPSVSQHIASLENHFGVSLFNRQKRRIRLTPEGRLLYSNAREILDRIEDVGDRITSLQSLETGTLSIGCSPYTGSNLVPLVLGKFASAFPAVKLSIITGDWGALEGKLKNNDLELLIHERKLNVNFDPAFICHPIGEEELVFAVSPEMHLPAGQLTPADLERFPFITYSTNNALNSYHDDFAIQHQIRFDSRLTVDNLEVAKNLVAEGLGIALLTRTSSEIGSFGKLIRIIELTASQNLRLQILAIYHQTQGLTYAGWEMLKLLERSMPEIPDSRMVSS